MRYQTLCLLTFSLVASSGCHSSNSLTCASSEACSPGEACYRGRCAPTCTSDADCDYGTVCAEGVCLAGKRAGPPALALVYGEGSTACSDASQGRCFDDHLIIEGTHLEGSAFRLDGARSYKLTAASGGSDERTAVQLPADLEEGRYRFVAANASGGTATDVQILRGEPGPLVSGTELLATINDPATSGRLAPERLPEANDMLQALNEGDGTVKLSAALLPPLDPGLKDGNEVVAAINGNVTTSTIRADRVALAPANSLLSQLNLGDGTVRIDSRLLPAATVGQMSGDEIINAVNDVLTAGSIAAVRVQGGDALVGQLNASGTSVISATHLPSGDALVGNLNSGGNATISANHLPGADATLGLLNNATTTINAIRIQGGDALVGQINASGNATISANHLPGADATLGLLNNATTTINAVRIQGGDALVGQINASGNAAISANHLPGADATLALLNNATSTISAARLEAGDNLVGRINAGGGSATIDPARLPKTTLHVSVSGPGSAVAIPDAELLELCGDAGGCTVSLGYKLYYGFDSILYGPPCRFHINPVSRQWSISESCAWPTWVTNFAGSTSYVYAPYSSGWMGTDNNDGTSGSDRKAVLDYAANPADTARKWVCQFTESLPVDDSTLSPDTSAGFYLYLATGTVAGVFDDASRTCELNIED
jgi:hypothetical protein